MKPLVFHENKQCGSQEFPIEYHYVTKEHPRYEMPYHWHEEAEIIHVISGQFLLVLDESQVILKAGDMAYIAQGRLHGGEPEECVYEYIVFDMLFLMKSVTASRTFIYEINSRKMDILPNLNGGYEGMTECLLPMFDALREQVEGHELIVMGSLMYFLGEVQKKKAYIIQTTAQDREVRGIMRLKRVFEMIEARPSNPPSLKEMASAVGMTPNHFCCFFRKATHYTPVDYIGFYRIEQACHEMLVSDKNVTEIAIDMGYCDLSNFIRCFKRYKGVSPGEYMKTLRASARNE